MKDLLADASAKVDEATSLLRELVEMESPSRDELLLDRIVDRAVQELERRGATVERSPAPGYGSNLLARFPSHNPSTQDQDPLLIMAHLDTVHDAGTLSHFPFELRDGFAFGPGAYDMKVGLVIALMALDVVRDTGGGWPHPLTFLVTCDEEIGAPSSRAIIEREARGARGCLVLEPCVPGGAVKTRRKGTGTFVLEVIGLPAHAGIEPEAGASAVHELARQMVRLLDFAAPELGTTLNVGVISGGTRTNVVAASATAKVDLRFFSDVEARRVDAAMRALTPFNPRCTLRVSGGADRGALERTDASAEMFATAKSIAARFGTTLMEGSTGGASDGNIVSAVGCPTLDGLGADGGGAHTLEERVRLDDLPFRIALIAGLIAEPWSSRRGPTPENSG